MLKDKNWDFLIIIAVIIFAALVFFDTFYVKRKIEKIKVDLCRGCNVVVIDVDLLRADAIDCKNRRADTPNLCRLLDRSVYFENNISHSDFTLTSMVSAMTSLYPSSHKLFNSVTSAYPKNTISLTDVLKQEKYVSVISEAENTTENPLVNKNEWFNWFQKRINTGKLTTELDNYQKQNQPYFVFVYTWKLHAPYVYGEDDASLDKDSYIPKGIPLTEGDFNIALGDYLFRNSSDVFTERAVKENGKLFKGDLINRKTELVDLYYSYDRLPMKEKYNYLKNSWDAKYRTYFSFIKFTNPADLAFLKDRYLSKLKLIDKELASLIDYLEKPAVENKTIVIFRSDHGEEFFEHGGYSHQNDLYQELIHTPLAIKVPGVKPSLVSGLTQDIDLMPTILDLLGIAIPEQAQGKSLRPLLSDPSKIVRDYQIAQKGGDNYVSTYRLNNKKIIIKQGTPVRLYFLDTDPHESKNVIADNMDIAKELFDKYSAILKTLRVYATDTPAIPTLIEDQKREKLKNEGYF